MYPVSNNLLEIVLITCPFRPFKEDMVSEKKKKKRGINEANISLTCQTLSHNTIAVTMTMSSNQKKVQNQNVSSSSDHVNERSYNHQFT